jgi:hypothetical protein
MAKKNDRPEQKTLGDEGSGRTAMALIPPTSLAAPRSMSEAEKTFLEECDEAPEAPSKIATIAVNHGGVEFVMPSGETIDGADGIEGFIVRYLGTRAYYEDAYSAKGDKAPPTCRSADCIAPDADVIKKQSEQCWDCEHNQFGTAIVGKGKACTEHLRLVLVNPAFGNPPIAVLTLPPTSISIFKGGTMIVGGKRGYLDQLKAKRTAWQLIWSRIRLTKEEGASNCLPVFEMGESIPDTAEGLQMTKALASLNNQFGAILKAMRRQPANDQVPPPGSGDAAE